MEKVMGFISGNIAYILVVVGVVYIGLFLYSIFSAKGRESGMRFRFRNLIGFTLVLGFAIYCLVTGQNITDYLH